MAEYVAYANYVIFFQDQTDYDFAIAAAGGNSIELNPFDAATLFDIPWPLPTGDMAAIPKGMYGFGPYGIPGHPGPGVEVSHPNPSGVFLTSNVDSVLVPGQVGNPAWPVGPDMRLTWVGNILKAGGAVEDSDDPTPIPPRRWIGGLELLPMGEGGQNAAGNSACRDASRTMDGFGFPIRGANSVGTTWQRRNDELITGFTTRSSWERLYVRIRSLPSAEFKIWRCGGSITALAGCAIAINPTGTISIKNGNINSSETTLGTSPDALDLDTWYLLDVLLSYPSIAAESGTFRLYLNHELLFSFTVGTGLGIDVVQFHADSFIGNIGGGSDATVEIDLDDWICADIPNKLGVESLDSVDWYCGSHVRRHFIVSGTSVGWTGSIQSLNQGTNPLQQLNSQLVSTTSGALIDAITDASDDVDAIGIPLGPVAAIVSLWSTVALSTDGQLGYSIAGGAPVMATINQTAAGVWNQVLYRPSGLILPESIVPFNVRFTKSVDANSTAISYMQAVVEYIGAWGLEDFPDTIDLPRSFIHNCNYPNTIWALPSGVPESPVYAVGGTYTGNGTTQSINLPAPCHFLWIRALTGGVRGVKWFGTSISGHFGTTERVVPNYPIRVYVDSTGQAKFTVAGTNVEVNASGVTFQYIAFCDPGARFNLCGAFQHSPVNGTNLLADGDFFPYAGFAQKEVLSNTSNVEGLSFKGPGSVGDAGTQLNGTNLASWGSFAQGILNSLSSIHMSGHGQTAYSLWRTSDINCSDIVMCQILTYTGDGTASRNIPLTPTTGRFPLFALVIPANTAAHMRDPSHTGTNSANVGTLGNSTTAITGGAIDQITVGITLNANGVVYNVFVIPGDTAGWNNGTFFPPDCESAGTQWELPPNDPAEIAVIGEGGLVLNGQVPLTLLRDISGIYTLVPGKTDDTLYDRQTGQSNVDVKIPDPFVKTGFIGG
jgi:hypothetical protein